MTELQAQWQMRVMHGAALRAMVEECGVMLKSLKRDRNSIAVLTLISLSLITANFYFVGYWSAVHPVWLAALAASLNLTSAIFLGRSLCRFWRNWIVAWRQCRQTLKQLLQLAAYYEIKVES